jgi:2,5-diamino-6-(ribosylamino)-4(3H)-pyrimidinone 5'-phosphate reductase
MLPRVIVYNAVSIDGRIDCFTPDIGQFYGLAGHWQEDATLAGSETIVQAEREAPEDEPPASAPGKPADDHRPLLAIVDSRGRVRRWHFWRTQEYWRDVVALCSHATPRDHLAGLTKLQVPYIVAGEDRVDLRAALEELATRFAVRTVRVDSGGTLNGALLRAGLVDEVSVLLHPCLVGGMTPRSLFRAPDLATSEGVIPLKLTHLERLENDLLWLRYEVLRSL